MKKNCILSEKKESIYHVENIQYLYLLNKYIKCELYRNQIRYNYETNCILKRKKGEYIPCLKYSVPIFVE